MARYLYSELASTLDALKRLEAKAASNGEWIVKHVATIGALCKQHLPSGSGFDNGSVFDTEASHAEKLVFTTSFHHMNDGYYNVRTDHTITVTPSFQGINIRISGRNRNDIKEAIHQAFDSALKTDVTYDLLLAFNPDGVIKTVWRDECTMVWSAPCGYGGRVEYTNPNEAKSAAVAYMQRTKVERGAHLYDE